MFEMTHRVISSQEVDETLFDVVLVLADRDADANQIASSVGSNKWVTDASNHLRNPEQSDVDFSEGELTLVCFTRLDLFVSQGNKDLLSVNELVALDQTHLDVKPRQKLSDRGDFEEPVQARLLG